MGDIAIVGLGKPYGHESAPISDYTTIFSGLGGGHGGQNLTPGFIIVNGAGEDVGYSTQLRADYNPQTVADHIKSGGTWVDYCGWPFYYHTKADGTSVKLGAGGWATFVENLGFGWLNAVNWNSSGLGQERPFITTYPYVRGFPLTQSLDGVAYSPNYTVHGYTAMIALVHPSGGHYFWGVYTPENEVLDSVGPMALTTPRGISVSTYVSFIRQVLHGDFSGLSYVKYYLNNQRVGPSTTSPSSPTNVVTSPGPSGGSSTLTGTTTTKTTVPSGSTSSLSTVCPSGYQLVNGQCVLAPSTTPSWLKPAVGIGLIVAGGGGVWYLGKQEGWWRKNGSKPQS